MSDLAPFVAAVLRDKVVAELNDELMAAKAKLTGATMVTVTGPWGQPVYAAADFSTGVDDEDHWIVSFEKQNDDTSRNIVPGSGLCGLEVHMGGILLHETGHDIRRAECYIEYTETGIILNLISRICDITLEILEADVSEEDWGLLRGQLSENLTVRRLFAILVIFPHVSLLIKQVVLVST